MTTQVTKTMTSILLTIMAVKLIQVTLASWRLIQQMKKAMKYVHIYCTYIVCGRKVHLRVKQS